MIRPNGARLRRTQLKPNERREARRHQSLLRIRARATPQGSRVCSSDPWFVDVEERDEDVRQRSDGECVDDRADSDRAAECPSARQDA